MLVKVITIFLYLALFISCGNRYDNAKTIDISKRDTTIFQKEDNALCIASGAKISPKETLIYSEALLNYIGKKLDKPLKLVQRQTYDEINKLIEDRAIDLALVGSGPYVRGKEKFGMELIAAPVINGKTVHYSYIIVQKNSPVEILEDLKGKIFAFADIESNTGFLALRFELAKLKTNPNKFFKKHIFTYSHDNSIKAVAQGLVDGAVVDCLIWEYLNKRNNRFTSKTKIIKKLGPFGIPPVVVHPLLSSDTKKKFKEILFNMHEDKKGKLILRKLGIDKFSVIDDASYNSIREMKKQVDLYSE